MSKEALESVYHSANSLDPSYDGIECNDIHKILITLAAWNVQGRPIGVSNDDRVRSMIDSAFNDTFTHIDTTRNDIEVQRLELLAERQLIEAQNSELQFEKEQHESEKKDFEANGARLVAATAG